jgi:hypothetical protein
MGPVSPFWLGGIAMARRWSAAVFTAHEAFDGLTLGLDVPIRRRVRARLSAALLVWPWRCANGGRNIQQQVDAAKKPAALSRAESD